MIQEITELEFHKKGLKIYPEYNEYMYENHRNNTITLTYDTHIKIGDLLHLVTSSLWIDKQTFNESHEYKYNHLLLQRLMRACEKEKYDFECKKPDVHNLKDICGDPIIFYKLKPLIFKDSSEIKFGISEKEIDDIFESSEKDESKSKKFAKDIINFLQTTVSEFKEDKNHTSCEFWFYGKFHSNVYSRDKYEIAIAYEDFGRVIINKIEYQICSLEEFKLLLDMLVITRKLKQ